MYKREGTSRRLAPCFGAIVETLSFDPWGRRRNAVNWSYTGAPTTFLFDRGYTGHEHLDKFGLINMNGRVYDPYTAHFLSPDNIVQAPDFTQNYNRYAYCMNNPLKYTDPSGYEYTAVAHSEGGGCTFYNLGDYMIYLNWLNTQSVNVYSFFDIPFSNSGGGEWAGIYIGGGNYMTSDQFFDASWAALSGGYTNKYGGTNEGIRAMSYERNNGNATINITSNLNAVTSTFTNNDFSIITYRNKSGLNYVAFDNRDIKTNGTFYTVPSGGGGNGFLKDLTDITGLASTMRTGGEMYWNRLSKAQQQKHAYNIQKRLKSDGVRLRTSEIKAGIKSNLRVNNYKLGAASGILIATDIAISGEVRPSHVVNGIMTGIGLTGWGSPVAAGYFIIDLGMGLFYDGGLSGYIDNRWGSPLYDF